MPTAHRKQFTVCSLPCLQFSVYKMPRTLGPAATEMRNPSAHNAAEFPDFTASAASRSYNGNHFGLESSGIPNKAVKVSAPLPYIPAPCPRHIPARRSALQVPWGRIRPLKYSPTPLPLARVRVLGMCYTAVPLWHSFMKS